MVSGTILPKRGVLLHMESLSWGEALQLSLNTFVVYILALLGFRMMGKRSVGKLSAFDVLVIIMIGEAGAIAMEEPSKNLLASVIPLMLLVIFQILLSIIATRNQTAERLSEGDSSRLVRDGQMDEGAMKRERITEADIRVALRENDVEKLSDVKELRIEPSGKFSVSLKASAKPVTARQLEEILTRVLDRMQKS